MLPGHPSRTLLGPAIRRAAHQLLDAPLILNDPVAVGLVPEADARAIEANLANHQTRESVLLRSLFVMRSRFAEDSLAQAAARGVDQYVIVGAGLETFPWRQPDYANCMRIFVADHISSLIWTQAKFWERGLPKPANVAFVPLDLEQDAMADRLAEFGFDAGRAAFCSALGVTQYIERAATERLLSFVSGLGAESEIVFSYVPSETDLAGPDRDFATTSARRAGAVGEEWKTRFSGADIVGLVKAVGFGQITHLTPERAQQLYFASRTDGLGAPSWEQLIAARI